MVEEVRVLEVLTLNLYVTVFGLIITNSCSCTHDDALLDILLNLPAQYLELTKGLRK